MIDYPEFFRRLRDGLVTVRTNSHPVDPKAILGSIDAARSCFYTLLADTRTHADPEIRSLLEKTCGGSLDELLELASGDDTREDADRVIFAMAEGLYDCPDCGEELRPRYVDMDTVELVHYHGLELARACVPYQGGVGSGIVVPSGALVFCNYFSNISEKPARTTERRRWSLNNRSGERRVREFLARQGFAYGQVGNACANPYVSPDRRHIIVLYRPATDILAYCGKRRAAGETLDATYEENERQARRVVDGGYRHIGRITCTRWRWMAADRETLRPLPGVAAVGDTHHAEVEPGNWRLDHYEDNYHQGLELLSEMTLV